MVTIISGANELSANVAGQTVSALQSTYTTVLNIPAGAKAQINGRPAGAGDTVKVGDRLVFAAATAEKGLTA